MLNTLTLEEAAALLDASPLAILLLDRAGRVRAYNRAFASLAGDAACASLALPENLQKEELLGPLLGRGALVNWIMPDGDERWLAVESLSLAGNAGGTARFYLDVTEKLRLRKERDELAAALQEHSFKDEILTSLMNRRGILHSLEPLVARSRRYDSPLSVIAMGIEAQPEREKLLVRISHLLKDQTRWADLVGCNDSHDFLLILQDTTRESALRLVEKLSVHLERLGTSVALPLKACYGVTHCLRDDDPKTLLERAEAALGAAREQQNGAVITL